MNVLRISGLLLLVASFMSFSASSEEQVEENLTVFELRTYTTEDGKMGALHARFQNHTIAIFDRLGMQSVGYWTPEGKPNTLIYILKHKSRTEADKAWGIFMVDPAWAFALKESGVLLAKKPIAVFMSATDYSALK
jgi:hypothetical protein